METELDKQISILLNSDLTNRTVVELVEELGPLITGHSVIAPKIASNHLFFRARVKDHVNTVSELSNPPPNVCQIGRANDVNESIFYCSPDFRVVFFEVDLKPNDIILVSRWRTTEELLVNHIGFHDEIFSNLGSSREIASIDGKSGSTWHVASSQSLWSAMAKLFIANKTKYKLSVAVSKIMLGDLFDGLMYPSIAMFGNADNVAFKSNVVSKSLRFVGVEKIRVKAIRGTYIDYDSIDYATTIDGQNLKWKGSIFNWAVPPGQTFKAVYLVDRIAMYNESGVEVDPE